MVELQDTHGRSSSRPKTDWEDWSLRLAGPARPAEPRHLPVRTDRDAGQARLAGPKAVEDNSGPDRVGRRPSYSVVGSFLPTISRSI
jgi:hypothetical protein